MTDRITYTIRRVAAGRSNFARVTVGAESESVVSPSLPETPRRWIEAANKGMQYAIAESGATDSFVVLEIEGTIADTREDTVFTAAAIATFRMVGDQTRTEMFVENEWRVSSSGGCNDARGKRPDELD